MSKGAAFQCGQCDVVPGVCATIESGECSTEEENVQSELFRRIHKEAGGFTHNQVSHFKHCLVDVEAFVKPIVVIPDIGGPPNDHFLLRDRSNWKEDFESWLDLPDKDDEIDDEIANMATGRDFLGLSDDESSQSAAESSSSVDTCLLYTSDAADD